MFLSIDGIIERDASERKAPVYPDQRLQSPLKPDIGQMAYCVVARGVTSRIPPWIVRTARRIKQEFPDSCRNLCDKTWSDISGMIYQQYRTCKMKDDYESGYKIIMSSCATVTRRYKFAMTGTDFNADYSDIWNATKTAHAALCEASRVKVAIDKTSRTRDVKPYEVYALQCRFIVSRQLILVDNGMISVFCDHDAMLLMCDVLEQRYLCLLSANLLHVEYPMIYTLCEDDFLTIFRWGDEQLIEKGNEAYNIIKFFEPLCAAALLTKDDPAALCSDFRRQRIEDYRTAGGRMDLLQDLEKVLERLPHIMLSEVFGLFRLWGHPIVDERAGCLKVQLVGKDDYVPQPKVLRMAYACLVREFCINFIRLEGKWPQIFVRDPDNRIGKLYATRQLNWLEDTSDHRLEDWFSVTLLHNLEFDYYKDYMQMVEDKSISCYREHWDAVYDATLLGYNPPRASEARRVILELLRREDLSIKEILDRVQRNDIPESWYIVGLHAKERELKIEPRLFIMMCLEMRLYFCATEANIAEKVFKYFPQQTMTTPEHDLLNRILNLTDSRRGGSNALPITINIDFEKWNLHWKENTTDIFFRMLDNLFATPGLYTFSHRFFRRSMFYLVSKYMTPSGVTYQNRLLPPESDTVWSNDGSGKEGIRQKGWTFCTIGLLLYVEHLTGIRGVITGQGDNQVIVAYFPIPPGITREDYLKGHGNELRSRTDAYFDTLISVFGSVGLPIKREESWVSSNIFAYGKDYVYRGSVLPMALKRGARISADVNDVFPSLANAIATVFSAGQAMCPKGYDIFVPYFISLSQCQLYILRYSIFSPLSGRGAFTHDCYQRLMIDPNFLMFCALIPHSLGGYPCLTPLDFAVRGHPDPVTGAIVALRMLSLDLPICGKFLSWLERVQPFSSRTDYAMLMMEPTSINWDVPAPPTYRLKRSLEEHLVNACKNVQFRKLFHTKSSDEDRMLIEYLVSTRPFSPRVVSELYRLSPSGARLGILAAVSHVRTVKLMAQQSDQYTLFAILSNHESSFMRHMLTWYDNSLKEPSITGTCSRILADVWRSRSWFPDQDVPFEGITAPHPLEQFKYHQLTCDYIPKEAILYILEPTTMSPWIERGPNRPYIGSLTKERKVSRILSQPVNDPPIEAALRLQTICDYVTSPGSLLEKAILQLAATRTNVPTSYLRCAADRIIAGTRTHRLQDVLTKHGGLINVRPTFNSHVYISTDYLGKFQLGTENYNINYQLTMLYGTTFIQYRQMSIAKRMIYASIPGCPDCWCQIIEDAIETPGELQVTYPDYTSCYLLYSSLNPRSVDHFIEPGLCTKTIEPEECDAKSTKISTEYMYALQSILRTDRSLTGTAMAQQSKYPTASGVIIGIGEIATLGFCDLVIALAHLNLIMFYIKYFNRLITARGITAADIMRASTEVINLDLFKELRDAYPIDEVRRQVLSQVNLDIEPVGAGRGGAGVDMVIKAIIDDRLRNRVVSMRTLPPIQCGSFPEWFLCLEMNLVHRVIRMMLSDDTMNDYHLGHICVALKTVRINLPVENADNILTAMSDAISSRLPQRDAVRPGLWSLYDVWDLSNIKRFPILRTTSGCEKWLAAVRTFDIIEQMPNWECKFEVAVLPKFKHYQSWSVPSAIKSKIHEDPILEEIPTENRKIKIRQDHMFRLDGVSTAHYKYLPLVRDYLENVESAICLGEGEGSVACMLIKAFGATRVFYNSLLSTAQYAEHRYVHYVPSCLIGLERFLFKFNHSLYGQNDLTLPDTADVIGAVVMGMEWDVMTCDAEISKLGPDVGFKLLRTVLLLACKVLNRKSLMIFKTYCGMKNIFKQQVAACHALFEEVTVITPTFSSYESTEVFICCTRLRDDTKNEVVRILQLELYPSGISDVESYDINLERYLQIRTASKIPLQCSNYRETQALIRLTRDYFNKPIARMSLKRLTGDLFNGGDLCKWLAFRGFFLTRCINVMVFALYEQGHFGHDWERLARALSRGSLNVKPIYDLTRCFFHCIAIFLTAQAHYKGESVMACLRYAETALRTTLPMVSLDGTTLYKFRLLRNERVWRKIYARHFYHVIGEILLMSE